MPPSTRKIILRGDKKSSPISTTSDDKHDTSKDSVPLSMYDLFLLFTKLLDDRLVECTKNLDKDVDSKVHERVYSTFQILKLEHDSKLEEIISATTSKVTESANNKFDKLHSKVDYTVELKLAAADSALSSKLETTF